jgi:hypothetical protein
MSGGLFMTLGAAEELRRHRWTCLSWKLADSGDWLWDFSAPAYGSTVASSSSITGKPSRTG